MYQAKDTIVLLLRTIHKREKLKKVIDCQEQEDDENANNLKNQLRLLSGKLIGGIEALQLEHKIFRGPFIINEMDYLEKLREEYESIDAGGIHSVFDRWKTTKVKASPPKIGFILCAGSIHSNKRH